MGYFGVEIIIHNKSHERMLSHRLLRTPCCAGFGTVRFAYAKAIRQTEVWCSPLLCKDCADYVGKQKRRESLLLPR